MSKTTPLDFISFVGHTEAVQLTQVDNPDIDSVDYAKIQQALDSAYNLLTQKVSPSWNLFAESELRVARKLLDPYTTREVVTSGYQEVWEWVTSRSKPIHWS
jgi:hypothetical protein